MTHNVDLENRLLGVALRGLAKFLEAREYPPINFETAQEISDAIRLEIRGLLAANVEVGDQEGLAALLVRVAIENAAIVLGSKLTAPGGMVH